MFLSAIYSQIYGRLMIQGLTTSTVTQHRHRNGGGAGGRGPKIQAWSTQLRCFMHVFNSSSMCCLLCFLTFLVAVVAVYVSGIGRSLRRGSGEGRSICVVYPFAKVLNMHIYIYIYLKIVCITNIIMAPPIRVCFLHLCTVNCALPV